MRHRSPPALLIGFAAVMVLSACAGSGDGSSTGTLPSRPVRSFAPIPLPTTSGGSADGIPEEMLADVVDQAASDAGVDPSAVEVLVAEAVTWNDGSLGCPEPGMSYTQALVPGYRVVVEVDGEELHYHAGQSGEFRRCDNPQPPLSDNPND